MLPQARPLLLTQDDGKGFGIESERRCKLIHVQLIHLGEERVDQGTEGPADASQAEQVRQWQVRQDVREDDVPPWQVT